MSYLHSMSGFLLLRHARATWPLPGQKDFDRPLSDSGREDAAQLGAKMANSGLDPDSVICSPVCRAAETWEQISPYFPGVPFTYDRTLYEGDPNAYLTLIRSAETSGKLLIIGHNPMIEDLALALSVNHDQESKEKLLTGFPACGLAVFEVRGSLAGTSADTARLSGFITPQMA